MKIKLILWESLFFVKPKNTKANYFDFCVSN